MHNVHHLLDLMRRAREAILEDRYPEFVKAYFSKLYGGDETKFPTWAVDALQGVGVSLVTASSDPSAPHEALSP